MTTTKEILAYINELYPLCNAAEFDKGKIGMQFGSKEASVAKVILALDTTMEVIDEAIVNGANLIISHHPFMFAPLLNLDYDSPFGQKFQKVINHKINIMAFHTNFDVANGGMNDVLAKVLGLKDIHYLTDEICADSLLRVGSIDEAPLEEVIALIKKAYSQEAIRYVGDLKKPIKTIGIVGGAGSTEFYDALGAGCDLFITGQIPHHLGLEAMSYNMALVEVSHAVEYLGVVHLREVLAKKYPNVEFILASNTPDPFKIL